MSEEQVRLVVQRGSKPGTVFVLSQETVKIGRSPTCDITITDPELSRQHAQFIRQGDGYALQDLGSTNGTFVNYRRITSLTPLIHGDLITLGEVFALDYQIEGATESYFVPIPETEQAPETAVPPQPASEQRPPTAAAPEFATDAEPATPRGRRRWLIGCAIILMVICLCVGSVYFLDAYQQGRLLYCGPIRPFWDFILGPFGFNPACT